jgi:hypothetical protein
LDKFDNAKNHEDLKELCYRNHYRISLDAPKSTPDELRTGLDYIEMISKIHLEFADKERQESVYRAPLWAIGATLLVGTLALFANLYVGLLNVDAAKRANDLKDKELNMKAAETASQHQDVAKPFSNTPSSAPAY